MTASPCDRATRPHVHLGDGEIRVYARDRSWSLVTDDDGSVCTRDVTPTPPTIPPERVMAFLLSARDDIQRDYREGVRP